MISSVVVHITRYTTRLKSSVLKSLDALFTTTAFFVSHFVELVRLCRNQAGTQDSSLCWEFSDDARLALHDCRESKTDVVNDRVGDEQPLPWVLSGLLHLHCDCTMCNEEESKSWICAS